jgi:hypothetical protein
VTEEDKLKEEIKYLKQRIAAAQSCVNRAQRFRNALNKIVHCKRCDCHARVMGNEVVYETKKTIKSEAHHFNCPISIADRALTFKVKRKKKEDD